MADLKVNPETGQLAIPLPNGGWKLYAKGEYKFNEQTGQYAVPQEGGKWKLYQHEKKGGFLPMSADVEGNLSFDPNAGILGSIISGLTAPGDVASGKLDPNSPEGIRRAQEAAGLMIGANPMVASGDRAIPGVMKALKPAPAKVPSAAELKAAGAAGFTKAENLGVDYSTMSVKQLMDDLTQQLQRKGIREKRAPDTFSLFNEIKSGPDKSVVSLTGLREIRDALRDIAGDFGPTTKKTDRKAAQDAIRALDQFMEEPPPSSVVVGTGVSNGGTAVTPATRDAFNEAVQRIRTAHERAKEAGALVKEANANYAAGERANTITAKTDKADISAAATGSGLNLDNRTRQLLAQIIDPERPRNRRGYSQEELAFIDDIVHGKHGADLARWWGNFLGGGGGMGAVAPSGIGAGMGAGLGALAGGPIGAGVGGAIGGALPPFLGRMLRGVSNRITTSQADALNELVRQRSPLYQKALENPPMVVGSPEAQLAIIRALLMPQQEQQ